MRSEHQIVLDEQLCCFFDREGVFSVKMPKAKKSRKRQIGARKGIALKDFREIVLKTGEVSAVSPQQAQADRIGENVSSKLTFSLESTFLDDPFSRKTN